MLVCVNYFSNGCNLNFLFSLTHYRACFLHSVVENMLKEPVPCFVNLRGQDLLLVSEVHMAPWQCAECGAVLSLYGGAAATPQETGLIEV